SPIAGKEIDRYMFVARNFARDESDEKFRKFSLEVAEQDRVVVENQRPEALPLDLSEELHPFHRRSRVPERPRGRADPAAGARSGDHSHRLAATTRAERPAVQRIRPLRPENPRNFSGTGRPPGVIHVASPNGVSLTDQERIDWLRLIRSEH